MQVRRRKSWETVIPVLVGDVTNTSLSLNVMFGHVHLQKALEQLGEQKKKKERCERTNQPVTKRGRR